MFSISNSLLRHWFDHHRSFNDLQRLNQDRRQKSRNRAINKRCKFMVRVKEQIFDVTNRIQFSIHQFTFNSFQFLYLMKLSLNTCIRIRNKEIYKSNKIIQEMKILIFLTLALLLAQKANSQIRPNILAPGQSIWPRPNSISIGKQSLTINDLQLVKAEPLTSMQHLKRAFAIYEPLFQKKPELGSNKVTANVEIVCQTCERDDEMILTDITLHNLDTYNLTISSNAQIQISSHHYFGVIRALESLSQLIIAGQIKQALPLSIINDTPQYRHRGLMVDTSRHYIPVSTLRQIIDGLMASKMNVLHWHIVDADSFPLVLPNLPDLAKNGAYSQDKIYTVQHIREVIQYANSRGVIIIPEIDMPGHTYSWSLTYPQIIACADSHSPQVLWGQLDPRVEKTFQVVKKVLDDVVKIFINSPVIHVGFDEAFPSCWNVTQEQSRTLMTDFFHQVSDYITNITQPNPLLVSHWDDMIADGIYDVRKGVVQNWHGFDYLKPMFDNSESYVVISSLGNGKTELLYLDCGYGLYLNGGVHSWCDPRKEWADIYDLTFPSQFTQNPVYRERILGAEAAMWSELVDFTNIVPRVFPRISALGEALWTNDSLKGQKDPINRFIQHRNLLIGRGVHAQPIQPESCQRINDRGRDGACHLYQSGKRKRNRPNRHH